jgi:4,5-DOPA dioxygenase extradiol
MSYKSVGQSIGRSRPDGHRRLRADPPRVLSLAVDPRASNDGDGTSGLMPVAFIGHGNPMNALELNRYTQAWRAFGAAVPRPRVILVVSAHWYINATAVTAMPRPRTIHDFYGFPRELFAVEYPAPGRPELAEQIADVVHPMWVGRDLDSWGIDHGTWSVLVHAFPDASIPVVQLSLNAEKGQDYHLALGQKLAALRREGVLVIGSGNIVHNLRAVDFSRPDGAYDWAQRFDDHAREVLLSEPVNVTALDADRDFRLAVPTPDHFLPLLYLAGAAADSGQDVTALVDGHAAGSISMASYTLGVDCPRGDGRDDQPAAALPDGVPADETNL